MCAAVDTQMDVKAEDWRGRVRKKLKQDGYLYRDLAREMKIGYTTFQNHLSDLDVRRESLWFIRELCAITNYDMPWVLFGIDVKADHLIPKVPWLTRAGVSHWMKEGRRKLTDNHVKSWFNRPDVIATTEGHYERMFVWQVLSNEVEDYGWPPNTWLYIDPDQILVKRESRGASPYRTEGSPLCLVRHKASDGLMVCRLETVANKIWVLPGNKMYPAHQLQDVDIVGEVIAGFRKQNRVI